MKAALIGYGSMGRLVYEELGSECVVVIAPNGPDCMNNLFEYEKPIDIIIDFSVPDNLNMIYDYASMYKVPVVIATTGYTPQQKEKILKLGELVPVLKSTNFSIGSILMNKFIRDVSPLLCNDFDIEIIEKNQSKKDKRAHFVTNDIIDAIKEGNDLEAKYDRNDDSTRSGKEIGVSIIKGGNMQPSHEVLYCGENEILSISHTELSPNQFAKGAYDAAQWLLNKNPGMYSMDDYIKDMIKK